MKRQQANGRTEPLPSDIEPVRRQLEAWRKTRQHRDRIPEPLWAAMAKLARTCGVSAVSGALGHRLLCSQGAGHRVPEISIPQLAKPG